jgi:hypothetical protein
MRMIGTLIRTVSLAGLVAGVALLGSLSAAAAAPAGLPAGTDGAAQNFTPLNAELLHKAQSNYYGGYTTGFGWGWGFNYIPACPYNYHYSCWYDPAYGYRHCGCWPNGQFFSGF